MLTDICDRLDMNVPIFAFSHCRDVVAAVTNSGGIGVLGATTLSPAALETDLTWIDNETKGRPYGVDLLLPMTFARPLAPHKDRSPIIFVRKRPSLWKCSINTSIT